MVASCTAHPLPGLCDPRSSPHPPTRPSRRHLTQGHSSTRLTGPRPTGLLRMCSINVSVRAGLLGRTRGPPNACARPQESRSHAAVYGEAVGGPSGLPRVPAENTVCPHAATQQAGGSWQPPSHWAFPACGQTVPHSHLPRAAARGSDRIVRRCLEEPSYVSALGDRARSIVSRRLGATRGTLAFSIGWFKARIRR